ncbi:hypothetical protein JCM11251_005540 [Rhodosporidiobolus azoricus]
MVLGRPIAGTRPLSTLFRDPLTRAVFLYVLLAPSASLLDTYIGSLSEYRFPHPLTATCFHFCLALLILLGTSIVARISQRLVRGRLPSILTSLASITSLSSPAIYRKALIPGRYAFLASVSSTLAALLDLRLSRTASFEFRSFVKLLPLLFSLVLPGARDGSGKLRSAIAGLVLYGGEGLTSWGHPGEWLFGVGWAAGIVGWVLAARAGVTSSGGMAELTDEVERDVEGRAVEEKREAAKMRVSRSSAPISSHAPLSPSLPSLLLNHLLLSLAFLLPLLLFPFSPFATELASIRRYRHYSFFTEVGFWAQEAGMAACQLVRLAVFLNLAVTASPPTTLLLPSLSSLLLRPLLTHLIFGNPLSGNRVPSLYLGGEGWVGEWTQVAVVGGVGGWAVWEGIRERERRGRGGRRKEG